MSTKRRFLCAGAGLWLAACTAPAAEKLAALGLAENSTAALARLRFSELHVGDRVDAGDLILCGERDRAVIGFSKKQVLTYLGLDAEWLVPELFQTSADEALLAVPPKQLARLRLPRGIGSEGNPPAGWVREVAGFPLASRDLGAALLAFSDEEELFAVRRETPLAAPLRLPDAPPHHPRRLGITVFPRMGPQPGVMIAEVEPGSPAAAAGLVKGDRILSVEGTPLRTFSELKKAISESMSPTIGLEILKKSNKHRAVVRVDLASDPAVRRVEITTE